MGYTIFTPPQITPATVVRTIYGQGDISVDNPEQVVLPAGTSVVYTSPTYSRFSAITSERTLLLNDPAGTATADQVFAAFPALKTSRIDRAKEVVSAELSKTDYKVIKQAEGVYTLTEQEKSDRQAVRDKFNTFETSVLNATDVDTVINAVFIL